MRNSQTGVLRCVMMVVLVIMTAFLASCSGERSTSATAVTSMYAGGMSDQGFVQVIDETVWYYDLKSGNSAALLCQNKSACKDNPYYKYDTDGYQIAATTIYKDSLYTFVTTSVNETALYRMKPQVDGRETIASIPWQIASGNVLIQNGKAYFSGVQYIVDENGAAGSDNQILTIICVDLDTGKVSELGEKHHYEGGSSIDSISVAENKLRYRYVYAEMTDEQREALINGQLKFEESVHLLKAQFYEIELPTGESKMILEGKDYPGISMEGDESYAYFINEQQTKVFRISFEDFGQTELFEGEKINALNNGLLPGAGLFFSQGFTNEMKYYYDFNKNKVIEIDLQDTSFPILAFNNWLAVGKMIDGQYQQVYMTIEDYAAGNNQYISMKRS
ncbi:hypothetical protein [Paenibacillus radicis (ex Gao et al. 2016)]|uniref:DUF5050 domain-containing protein n=1 Tax=Paenibacillus radicis (ex Gao et al. 2016) TaxID=1737354 RepID=A0A917M059_9BACL|nr:hypothetical protein [Paenibacillus radicis (ex Gao et al. 2016)]GGG67904.1 hypothetical protein GCM10010918_23330 [Paenibacillus radicis (ex Gao et al. 2016)]